MKIGYFTPTPDDRVAIHNRRTYGRDLQFCGMNGHTFIDLAGMVESGLSVVAQRNAACRVAKMLSCDYLYMVDSDVWADDVSPLERLSIALFDSPAVAVGAAVRIRHGAKLKTNVWPVRAGEVYECEAVSAACMLINITALFALEGIEQQPFFKLVYNDAGSRVLIDEGVYFCSVVRGRGGSVLASYTFSTIHQYAGLLTLGADGQHDDRSAGTASLKPGQEEI